MNIHLLELISIIGIAQGFFLSTLLLVRKKNKIANYFLSTLIFLTTTVLLFNLFLSNHILTEYYSLSVFMNTIVFLYPTLHLLYAIFLLSPTRKFTFNCLVHFMVFVGINILFIPVYFKNEFALAVYYKIFNYDIFNLALSLYSIVVMIYVLKLLKQHTIMLKLNFSSIEKINLNWLKVITIVIIIFDLLFVCLLYLPYLFHVDFSIISLILSLLMILLIYITAIFGFWQPEIFRAYIPPIQDVKYKTSGLTDEKALEIEKKLIKIMADKKPYLNDNLNIDELSSLISVTPAYLSQVINERLGMNFYTLINKYRIEEAKLLIGNSKKSNLKLESIAYDLGFNSKSTFNTAFKKFTGLTPSQFRVKISDSDSIL